MRIRYASLLISLLLHFTLAVIVAGQRSIESCELAGSYRINIESSDKLYSVIRDVRSRVPFGKQQEFFLDLSTRLTPPDMLAIECRGKYVTVGSSRAPKVTFLADGRTRREQGVSKNPVRSKVELNGGETLTFLSSGAASDNINVTFQSLDNGRRMRVVRRIYSPQLDEPVVIQSIYEKVAEKVNWETFTERTPAEPTAQSQPNVTAVRDRQPSGGDADADSLQRSFGDWIDATNRRDIDRQMTHYLPRLAAYYLTRNTPSEFVRREKARVFSSARSIDIRAEPPEIVFQDGGRTAVMRFNKTYRIDDRNKIKSGEVIQELRWRRTRDGWRISSERDIRVIR